MRIDLTDDDGQVHDVTEAVQIVYDAMLNGMEFGSGMLDTQEVDALRRLAGIAGWDPVEYDLDDCASCGHYRSIHRKYGNALCYAPAGKIVGRNMYGQEVREECGCAEFILADTPDPR